MNQNSKNKLEKVLKILIFIGSILVITVPILVFKSSYFPYIIKKTIILRMIIEAIFACYLILFFMSPKYRPKKSFLLWSVLAFFAVMLVSTFAGDSLARSWWGNWERMFGTFTYLHYLAWFVVLISVFKDIKDWTRIFNATLAVSVLISLYSLSQRLGLSFTLQSGLARVHGTIGNAAYLASYMLFHIFIALFFLIEKRGRGWKIFYLAVFLLDFFVLILSGTRGAQLALFGSLFIIIIMAFYFKSYKQKIIKYFLIACVSLIFITGILIVFKDTNFVRENYWLKRLTNYSLEDNTIQTRLRSWTWGLKGFRDNLLFGVGPENFQNPFNQYFEPDFYNYTGSEIWFDRAHNTLVDMAAMMGIFGLLSYLTIFGVVGNYLFELRKNRFISDVVFLILFLIFFTYFIQNIFVFDSLNSLILFYLFLAYIVFIYGRYKESEDSLTNGFSVGPFISIPISLIFLVFLFFGINIPALKANNYVYEAFVAKAYNKYDETIENYKKAHDVAINKLDVPVLMEGAVNDFAIASIDRIGKQKIIEDLEVSIAWTNEAIIKDPKNMFLYYIKAKTYSLLAEITLNSNDLEKGIAAAEKAHQLSPGRVRPLWLLARFYLFGGQPERALAYLNQAKELNDQQRETHYYLAVTYQRLGRMDDYYNQIAKLVDLKYTFSTPDQVTMVIDHFIQNNDQARTIYLFSELVRLAPNNLNYWIDYIKLLVATGQVEEVDEQIKAAVEENPDKVNEFYQMLKSIEGLTL